MLIVSVNGKPVGAVDYPIQPNDSITFDAIESVLPRTGMITLGYPLKFTRDGILQLIQANKNYPLTMIAALIEYANGNITSDIAAIICESLWKGVP